MSWLSSKQLHQLIKRFANKETKKAFIGIFPIDQLPKRLLHLPSMFIINTDTKNLPGKHWKAVYISSDRRGEVFDSLSLPVGNRLGRWLNTFTDGKWKRNVKSFQHPLSSTCGAYVLYYILSRLKASNMADVTHSFSNVLSNNDAMMLDFVSKLQKNKK